MVQKRVLIRILQQAYPERIDERDLQPLMGLMVRELDLPSQTIAEVLASVNGDSPSGYFAELDEIIEHSMDRDPEWRRIRLKLDPFGFRELLEGVE